MLPGAKNPDEPGLDPPAKFGHGQFGGTGCGLVGALPRHLTEDALEDSLLLL